MIQKNCFNLTDDFNIKNIYSDKDITKYDLLYKNKHRISTMAKPYIWRNHIYNLPTNSRFEKSNSKYSIGIEIIYCSCAPIILFSVLSKREIYSNYGYKIRTYRDINSSSFINENIIVENKLTNEEDNINKIIGYNEDNVNLIFSENCEYGVTDNNKRNYYRIYYFKEKNKKNSFFFIFESEINSDKTNKSVCRNIGFHIYSNNVIVQDETDTRQVITLREMGLFVGEYENKYLGIEPLNNETLDIYE